MELAHNLASVTVQDISKPSPVAPRHPNDVTFLVKYPEGFTGKKIMPEGTVVVAKEAAEKFTEMGIGQVVPDEPAPVVEEEGTVVVAKEAAEKGETKKGGKKGKPE